MDHRDWDTGVASYISINALLMKHRDKTERLVYSRAWAAVNSGFGGLAVALKMHEKHSDVLRRSKSCCQHDGFYSPPQIGHSSLDQTYVRNPGYFMLVTGA